MPLCANVNENVAFWFSVPESHTPVSDVQVCCVESKFFTCTIDPTGIVSEFGANAKLLTEMWNVFGGGGWVVGGASVVVGWGVVVGGGVGRVVGGGLVGGGIVVGGRVVGGGGGLVPIVPTGTVVGIPPIVEEVVVARDFDVDVVVECERVVDVVEDEDDDEDAPAERS